MNIARQLTVLAVRDLERSRAFYVDQMGFEMTLRVDGWVFLRRGGMALRLGHCPDIRPLDPADDHALVAQAIVDDAAALQREFKARGVDASEAADRPWGQREFVVTTPDGHRVLFTQTL